MSVIVDLLKMQQIADGTEAEGRRRTVELDVQAFRESINRSGDPVQMARSDESLLMQMHHLRLRFDRYFTAEQVEESQRWFLDADHPERIKPLFDAIHIYGRSKALDSCVGEWTRIASTKAARRR